MKQYLIVGLGNPGSKYNGTRHNIGFDVLDYMGAKFNVDFISERYGLFGSFKLKGRTIFLLKPSTFMNLSGKSVRYHLNQINNNLTNLLVVSDDLHFPFGVIKCRRKGSDGGHNGHKDIISTLQTSDYSRVKFGIGDQFKRGLQSNYVLDRWSDLEKESLKNLIMKTTDLITTFCLEGVDKTMKKFN